MMSSEQKMKTPLFSFQKLNKYFLLPFFLPIVCFSTKFFNDTMKTDNGKKDIKDLTEDNIHTFAFLYEIIQGICQMIGGSLYFITHLVFKTGIDSEAIEAKKNIYSNFEKDFRRYTNRTDSTKKKDYKKIIIILLMPLTMMTYYITLAYVVGHQTLERRIYFLFFVVLLSKIVFKKRIYRHQKFALIISVIGIIIIIIAFRLFLKAEEYNILYDILIILGGFGMALFLILIQYLTINKRMNLFLLLFYQGILTFIYTLIIFSTISLIIKNDFSYIYNIFYCDENNFICISHFYFNIIMYIILNIFLQLLFFLVVYFFSPELLVISDMFSPLLSFIAQCIQFKEKNVIKIVLTISGYLIILFGAIIYNELIVCNFCRLNENTWKAIDQKAYDDMNLDDNSVDSFQGNDNYKVEVVEPPDAEVYEEMNQY